jgi:hypothetical protein
MLTAGRRRISSVFSKKLIAHQEESVEFSVLALQILGVASLEIVAAGPLMQLLGT